MKDFFISYNQVDMTWAEWITWQLEEAGYTTLLQAWDFRPGSNFVLEMQRAAKKTRRTLAVLSPDYLTSRFTQPEWAAAFAQDPTGEQSLLVPVRVRECEIKGLLGPIIYIDLVGCDEPAAKAFLLAGVQRERTKPAKTPVFPGAIERSVSARPPFPGALPAIWNIPYLRNPNFTGREALLKDLRAAPTGGQCAALTQTLSGLGGIGKTQLALEYAYRHATDYAGVWWLRAEEPAALAGDYAALAGALELPEAALSDQREVIPTVRRWLDRQADSWLLVFDNATEPQQIIDYLPQGGRHHVLVTSRNPNWRGRTRLLEIPVWTSDESVTFLHRRTGLADTSACYELAEALGDLPLALEQAGAYIEAMGLSGADYLTRFCERQQALLQRGELSTDYPNTVATTWDLSFQQVEHTSPAGAALLNLCAFLAPEAIPQSLIHAGAEYLPSPLKETAADPLALDDALGVLRRYSLFRVEADTLTMHRLVQAVVRHRLGQAAAAWAEAAVKLVANAFPYKEDDVRTWAECARLLPHALTVAEQGEAITVSLNAVSSLLNNAGLYLQKRAQFTEAKTLLERALAIAEKVYGPDHPEVAIRANNLGLALKDLGDLSGAQALFERALIIDEQIYGPDHPSVARDANNLGAVLKDLGDLSGARAHYERALKIFRKSLGEDHPNTVVVQSNLRALSDQPPS